MTLDRNKTIDALTDAITSLDGGGANEVLVDALVNGRAGFNDMSDDELRGACEAWDVASVEVQP